MSRHHTKPIEKSPARSGLRNIELRLIAELIKNSRRSDREIARALGVSQPTVSRMIKNLENKGIVKEYTMIPDFKKIGYTLMGVTLLKLREASREKLIQIRRTGEASARDSPFALIMCDSGLGLGFDGIVITLYKDYSEYSLHTAYTKRFGFLEIEQVQSFLIDLKRDLHFHPLSFSTLAKHLANRSIMISEKP